LARFHERGARLKARTTGRRESYTQGFTLIEMAIVMVVIGLLLSGGILALAPVIQSSKTSDTNSRLDRVEQALLVYVIQNGCLPCPANPATASTVATAGQAVIGGVANPTPCTVGPAIVCDFRAGATVPGVVPWITLGLSEADATDGFGNRIAYTISNGLQVTNGMERTPPATYPSGTITVYNYAVTEPSTAQQTPAAAYVLVSYGPDASFGHAAGTGALQAAKYGQTAGDTSPEGTNATGGGGNNLFVQDTLYGVGGAGYFDDIVRWRTAPNIIQSCGSNACGNPAQ